MFCEFEKRFPYVRRIVKARELNKLDVLVTDLTFRRCSKFLNFCIRIGIFRHGRLELAISCFFNELWERESQPCGGLILGDTKGTYWRFSATTWTKYPAYSCMWSGQAQLWSNQRHSQEVFRWLGPTNGFPARSRIRHRRAWNDQELLSPWRSYKIYIIRIRISGVRGVIRVEGDLLLIRWFRGSYRGRTDMWLRSRAAILGGWQRMQVGNSAASTNDTWVRNWIILV